jgi:hypothetical protein
VCCVSVFITVPITKLFGWGGKGKVEDMCYERQLAEASVDWSAHPAPVTHFLPRA